MKKLILFSMAVFAIFSCCSKPQTLTRADAIAAQIHDPNSKYVVVICHRGDWRHAPENSIPAIEGVVNMGADIVELDVHMTADSVLVLCHDNNVSRTTNFKEVFADQPEKSPKVSDLTLAEIKQLYLINEVNPSVDTLRMPTLEEGFLCAKDKICVNVDKGYPYYDKVLEVAEKVGVVGQVLIKGKYSIDEVAATEARHEKNMMYMPIVDIQKEKGMALYNSYMTQNVVPLAYEVCWSSNEDGLFRQVASEIVAQGSKLWVNTLWGSLCGGEGNADEDAMKAEDPGDVYQQYLDAGATMIQTDCPELLLGWLEKKGLHTLN